jgi:ribose transport system ATP-binding protein
MHAADKNIAGKENAPDVLLRMSGIRKTYPGVVALDGVDLQVRGHEVHGLMGENGAGKSTLIKVLAGAVAPDSGEIHFDGKIYTELNPRLAMQLGIGVIYQEFNLIPGLSVAENLYLGNEFLIGPLVDLAKTRSEAAKLLKSLNIDVDPDTPVRELTVAYQQLVEIAKAVTRQVKLLIMDEPTAPLANREVAALFAMIERLKARGIAIVYISHRMEEIFELTQTVTVIRDGQFIGSVKTADTSREELVSMMVGRKLSETFPPGGHAKEEIALEVKQLCGERFRDVSFQLKRGEILGIAGLIGAGRTEIARVIFGADPKLSGDILLDGKAISIGSPKEAISHGIALIPEDRKQQGLLLNMSVAENTTLASLATVMRYRLIQLGLETELVERYIQKLRIKTPHQHQRVKFLSGGNQQKVVLSKWLETGAKVLIFDEPTRGIDVGAKQEIYQLMRELTASGVSILMISSEMPELIGVSDRILVIARGRTAGELGPPEFSQARILDLAAS